MRNISIPLSFIFTVSILIFDMTRLNFAPFGNSSFASSDAYIQYMDFFAFWQNVLLGNGSVSFSFAKGLGGNIWAVLSYYMFSPFNFIIVFFPQESFHTFYNILVVLKLSFSALTMAIYLKYRFKDDLPAAFVILFSVGFGLMQYNLEQAQNIMWLDNVYLLPLMMGALYYLRLTGKITPLTLLMAASIIFNWYTGLFTIMFVGLFSILEFAFFSVENRDRFSLKNWIFLEGKIILSILLAVGISAVIFCPTLSALTEGRGSIDWEVLSLEFHEPWAFFQGLTPLSRSEMKYAALYTGELTVFLFFMFFFVYHKRDKRIFKGGIIAFVFLILMLYWTPIIFLFSLLKGAWSYWCRYGDLACFIIVYLAAFAVVKIMKTDAFRIKEYIGIFLFPLLLMFSIIVNGYKNYPIAIHYSLIMYALWAIFFSLRKFHRFSKYIALPIFFILQIFIFSLNTEVLMNTYKFQFVDHYKNYVIEQKKQVDSVRNILDNEPCRITQSRTFAMWENGYCTANYNEGLAYNYPTIASYTSSPVNDELLFLEKMGYRQNGENMNIVNTPVLPTDSLLGVRYVFSDIYVDGLTLLPEFPRYNRKMTYKNDMAFPMAFVAKNTDFDNISYDGNPFLYTNHFFETLFGDEYKVYREVSYNEKRIDEKHIVYNLQTQEKSGAVYGNIPTKREYIGNAYVNQNSWSYPVSRWLGMSVFFIPYGDKNNSIVDFVTEKPIEENISPQFYAVNVDKLKAARDLAWENKASFTDFTDTHVAFSVMGRNGEELFTSIPYDKGWRILQNGKEATPKKIADCFIGLVLEDGENNIEFSYRLPNLNLGLAITFFSLMIIIVIWRRESGDNKQ